MIDKYGFTVQEAIIYKWQFNEGGGFFKALMNAIVLADDYNLAALGEGFPHEVDAIVAWRGDPDNPDYDMAGVMKNKMLKHSDGHQL